MMVEKLKKIKDHANLKWYLILFVIYFMSQGFLLIVSGKWYDDWGLANISNEGLRRWGYEAGRPSIAIIDQVVVSFPSSTYRIITFILYYIISIVFFKLLNKCVDCSKQESFIISSIFISLPVFDLRICSCVFAYVVGFFFFMIGFILLHQFTIEHTWKFRILALFCFVLSFTTNSCLILYVLPILYLWYREKKIWYLFKYPEYLVAPFIFFLCKVHFFPANGDYAGYNSVTIDGIFYAIKHVWLGDVYLPITVIREIVSYVFQHKYIFLLVVILLFISGFFVKTQKQIQGDERQYIKLILLGMLWMTFAIFPYVVIRNTFRIGITGWRGRDAILSVPGVALILYAVIGLSFKERVQRVIYGTIVICGILFFNFTYLQYQVDYYKCNGVQMVFSEHEELATDKVIMVTGGDVPTGSVGLNVMAEEVYGNENRLVVPEESVQSVFDIISEEYCEREWHHMTGFDPDYKNIDVIVDYNIEIEKKDALYLKWCELFNYDKYKAWFKENSYVQINYPGSERYESVVENLNR